MLWRRPLTGQKAVHHPNICFGNKKIFRQDEQDVHDIFCLSGRKAKSKHFDKTASLAY
jgi:hypothetical protein